MAGDRAPPARTAATTPVDRAPGGLAPAEAVARIGAELRHLADALRAAERVLFPVVVASGAAAPGSAAAAELQRFDATLQSVDALAGLLAALAGRIGEAPGADVAPLIAATRLARLTDRLLGRSVPAAPPGAVELL